LDSYLDYLKRRWDEGCHKAAQLFREIKDQGFAGSPYMVRRRVVAWREPRESGQTGEESRPTWRPSPRTVTWLLLKLNGDRTVEQEIFLVALRQGWPELMENVALIQEFRSLLRQRRPDDLDAWVALADEPSILPEIKQFAHNLHQDWAAVLEAIRQPWSNGQVEGQVNRLKTIKRQMYGRANFDLLRQRVLHGN
jgi:transposase